MMSGPLPIACDLGALDVRERGRRAELAARLVPAVRAIAERPAGFEVELDTAVLALAEAEELAGYERRCCPFLTLDVQSAPVPGRAIIRAEGPPGAKEFLVMQFGFDGAKAQP